MHDRTILQYTSISFGNHEVEDKVEHLNETICWYGQNSN